MIVYHGDTLKEFISNSLDTGLKERFIMKNLDYYISSGNDGKVFCLYGLRDTGKTVMMMQEVRKIGDYENCLWLAFQDGDSMWGVREAVRACPDCKYFFIDNITETDDFIGTCSFLADDFASKGMKIVIAGTDSLSFFLASNDELYHKVHMLHTTYVPFPEHHYLLGEDIMHYIRNGGTLIPESAFQSKEKLDSYIDAAITHNIANSLDRWRMGVNIATSILGDEDLSVLVNVVLEQNSIEFCPDIVDPDAIYFVDERSVEVIIYYMEHMDVLFPKKYERFGEQENELLFTQCGMRYDLVSALFRASNQFSEQVENILCEGILKEIVLQHVIRTIQTFPRETTEHMSVYPYKNKAGNRIDVLIDDYEKQFTIALEVSLSEARNEDQLRNLQNAELCQEIERKSGVPIIHKVVVYRGETASSGAILYLNVEEFLVNTAEWIIHLSSQHPER